LPKYFAFEVSLLGVKPRPWRSFLLRDRATFFDLHEAIQDACGWQNCHLFQFRPPTRGAVLAGVPDESGFSDGAPDAMRVPLLRHIGFEPGVCCIYEYDFGNSWKHNVVLTQIVERDGRATRVLTGGDRSFPPEDCGGIPGNARCVAAATGKGWTPSMGNKKERADLVDWLAGWRPDAFDLAATKRAFHV
jgi:hypothetical protein